MSSATDAVPENSERGQFAERAYRGIRDAIVAVELLPGSPLDEKSLSAWLQVGLTPVREALKRLTLEKLAVTYPRRGTYVSHIQIVDEARLSEVRVELEGLAASLAAARATAEDRAELQRRMADLEQGSLERVTHTDLDVRVHRAIYRAAHNDFLEATLDQYANLAMRIWNYGLEGRLAVDDHVRSQRDVVEAILRGDGPAARAAAQQHLRGFTEQVRAVVGARA